jgi:hypothetical protein
VNEGNPRSGISVNEFMISSRSIQARNAVKAMLIQRIGNTDLFNLVARLTKL